MKNKGNHNQLQHGDVTISKVDKLPANLRLVAENNVILAEGEATGHYHKATGNCKLMVQERQEGKYFFLIVVDPVTVTHEEHKPIELSTGNYSIGRVLEYDHVAEMQRNVID